ncbi:hypothetical protein [Spongiactinospora sp. TRM90649]|uniref:hypothetical protein n=1 Tax=Spongiactinospora sp. TRM90649 TaxID=3031114 RepID=UPI0023F9FFB1|nr:hypothetical protein [Spongiactinospora sp. TRM90649]MDF5759317.1 hypothetical protein [Spongiactinospora sp. TRM90649]
MRNNITEDPILDWGLGPPRHTLRWVLIALVAAVGAGAVVWVLSRSDPAPAPVTNAAASVASDAVALAAPSGFHGEGGYPIGFPKTELGAASAAAAALEAAWTLDPEQAEQAAVLYAPADQQQAARDGAAAVVRDWRKTLGLPEEGELPEGAGMRTTTIGVQWRSRAADQVEVSVLVQVTATKGPGEDSPAYSSPYAMSLLMAWRPDARGGARGDWVNVPDPQPATVPKVAAPGTPEFRAAGWKPIAGTAR